MRKIVMVAILAALALSAACTASETGFKTFFGEIPASRIPSREFNICDYGAKGDGTTTNTATFRAAVEACAQAGGGTIVIPS